MIDTERILFIPSTRSGNGTGHLKRCLEWGRDFPVQYLYSLDNDEKSISRDHPLFKQDSRTRWLKDPGSDWDLIVLDNRQTESLPAELAGIPVIAVDETGSMRDDGSYTLDILPNLSGTVPNLVNFGFFSPPGKKRQSEEIKKVLVTFGGEDPGSLGLKVLEALSTELTNRYEWTFILPFSGQPLIPAGVNCLTYVENLREELWTYDLVVTSYGLTAFESLAAGVNVLLLNPGPYHDRLSSRSGFTFLKNGFRRNPRDIRDFIEGNLDTVCGGSGALQNRSSADGAVAGLSFPDWLKSMTISSDDCPVCGSRRRKSIGRFPGKSYFQCGVCRMKYMVQFRQKGDIYGKEYFFSEYKAQYGKTYIEDFPHIRKMADERISRLKRTSGNLLDVGCAYGPFLLSAHDRGFSSWGLEISEDAVAYIKENFPQLNVSRGAFEETQSGTFEKGFFDVITFWYVIEHFQNLDSVLTRAFGLLKKGGVLALSTPHASGVSGLFNPGSFLEKSPEDHFTLWDRKSARRALKLYGFKNVRFYITGHHTERFPAAVRKWLGPSVLLHISRLFGWGDTFEIYAEKG